MSESEERFVKKEDIDMSEGSLTTFQWEMRGPWAHLDGQLLRYRGTLMDANLADQAVAELGGAELAVKGVSPNIEKLRRERVLEIKEGLVAI